MHSECYILYIYYKFGTLPAVSAITRAIKRLAFPSSVSPSSNTLGTDSPNPNPNNIQLQSTSDDDAIVLCGYSGLMLPVMEGESLDDCCAKGLTTALTLTIYI